MNPLQCHLCSQIFQQQELLTEHLKNCTNIMTSPSSKPSSPSTSAATNPHCQFCDNSFSKTSLMLDHIKRVHFNKDNDKETKIPKINAETISPGGEESSNGCVKISNDMGEACKTFCKICQQKFALSFMRIHTLKQHNLQITKYKEIYGNFHQDNSMIIEMVYHKCHICGKVVLLDNDTLGGHIKGKHKMSEKNYKIQYMTFSVPKEIANIEYPYNNVNFTSVDSDFNKKSASRSKEILRVKALKKKDSVLKKKRRKEEKKERKEKKIILQCGSRFEAWIRSKKAKEHIRKIMNKEVPSRRHDLFMAQHEREACSGAGISRLYELSNPSFLGNTLGGASNDAGDSETIIFNQIIDEDFNCNIRQSDPRLWKLMENSGGHTVPLLYVSTVLYPELCIHWMEVKKGLSKNKAELLFRKPAIPKSDIDAFEAEIQTRALEMAREQAGDTQAGD